MSTDCRLADSLRDAVLRRLPAPQSRFSEAIEEPEPLGVRQGSMECQANSAWGLVALVLVATPPTSQPTDAVAEALRSHQYDLGAEGARFLQEEAGRASFFLFGESHGDNECPALLRALWPAMWRSGYRHVAAEVSPWKASQLISTRALAPDEAAGLWRQADAQFVESFGRGEAPVLWGCDMEELRPDLLVQELVGRNPQNEGLRGMRALMKEGYRRDQAPSLLRMVREAGPYEDMLAGGASLGASIVKTLEIEVDRLQPATRLDASWRREALMKELFLSHYRAATANARPRVMARFGRNHLHRGYDRRGVSTLGNFLAELAVVEGGQSFHLAAFGAGGSISWRGEEIDADERKDDTAFEALASVARYPATVFDLRPLRAPLHRIAGEARSPTIASLVYWADSYDAVICYKRLTSLPR
jgi:hypothetical protein